MGPTRSICVSVAVAALVAAGAQAQQLAKFTPEDGVRWGDFGSSVSISGFTVVVGSRNGRAAGLASGFASVYRALGGDWRQIALITADDAARGDEFGFSVSISGDTMIAGSIHDNEQGDGNRHTGRGAAYIFREIDGLWRQVAKLSADDGEARDSFGTSVSISGDTAVVGAPFDSDAGRLSGSAYVFREEDGLWRQVAKLTADDAEAGDWFGTSVSISGDTVVVGAHRDNGAGGNSGSAYVFREVDGLWGQIAKLTADDAEASDHFGISVSIGGDTAVVGIRRDQQGDPDSGSAYVFREVDGVWRQIDQLRPDDGMPHDHFGTSVSIDRNAIVVGASGSDGAGLNSGSAYLFREFDGVWEQVERVFPQDGQSSDLFGESIAISGDVAAIGASGDDDEGPLTGSAYVFWVGSSCPADLDGDADADADDFFAYLDAFVAGNLDVCDIDNDGDCDAEDFLGFLNLFASGCP